MVRTRQRSVIAKLSIASVVVLVTTLVRAGGYLPPNPRSPAAAVGTAAPQRFQITGRVDGLFPGIKTRLRLSIRNPNPVAIVVRRIRTIVQPAGGMCPPGTIRVQRFTGSRRIPALGIRRVTMMVRMLSSVPDTCAGQRYRLSYRGSATLA